MEPPSARGVQEQADDVAARRRHVEPPVAVEVRHRGTDDAPVREEARVVNRTRAEGPVAQPAEGPPRAAGAVGDHQVRLAVPVEVGEGDIDVAGGDVLVHRGGERAVPLAEEAERRFLSQGRTQPVGRCNCR
jgi:hypothetical protein